uniref:G-protein coupled receptors family 1 profile domain-containing protein n=1 Tax=Caenorhabditis japonica TaxID=281687 RepID=A0A8R1ITV5_CAEJA
MNLMMAVLLFQWFEAVLGKLIMIPYQIGVVKIVDSSHSYVNWWSDDVADMILVVEEKKMHCYPLLFASFLVWHYVYSMIFGILNLGLERIAATVFLRDYEKKDRVYIPVTLIICTHIITIPFSILVLTNSTGFYFGVLPCLINVLLTFVIFTVVSQVNKRRHRQMERGCDYSLAQQFQVKENCRALMLAKNLLIVVLCAMTVQCGLLIVLVIGWLAPFETLFIHVMENSTFMYRMAIIRGRQMGLDMPTFAKQFKTSKSVIWATSNTPNLSKATGRPSKTSSGDDRITVRMSKKNPRLTSTNINSELKDQYGVQDSFLNISQKISVDMAYRCPRTLSKDVCATRDSSESAQ